jgi:hypothetical protein
MSDISKRDDTHLALEDRDDRLDGAAGRQLPREEIRENGLKRIREAVALVQQKATPQELEDYRRFVTSLASRVAGAKTEGEEAIGEAEAAAIAEISEALKGA